LSSDFTVAIVQLGKKSYPAKLVSNKAGTNSKHLYPNAGFKEKNHIQICVRTPGSIKGFFRPIDSEEGISFEE
jgi:hypothetical protein